MNQAGALFWLHCIDSIGGPPGIRTLNQWIKSLPLLCIPVFPRAPECTQRRGKWPILRRCLLPGAFLYRVVSLRFSGQFSGQTPVMIGVGGMNAGVAKEYPYQSYVAVCFHNM